MPKLQAKGKSDFVTLNMVPTEMAKSEANIILSALRAAVDGLLEIVMTPSKTPAMEEQALRTLLMLKSLRKGITEDLERVDLVLSVVEEKMTNFGGV